MDKGISLKLSISLLIVNSIDILKKIPGTGLFDLIAGELVAHEFQEKCRCIDTDPYRVLIGKMVGGFDELKAFDYLIIG
jgi:hypothetical protein